MKKTACLYAIVRFMPFVETGEFANVGIVMMAPEQRYFAFKLMVRCHARVTRFFEQLEGKVFRATIRNLQEELNRTTGILRRHGFDKRLKVNGVDFAKGLFAEIIRPRETIIKFSEPRAILADDLKKTLTELYGHYVGRTFVITSVDAGVGQHYLTNRVFPGWWGDVAEGEEYLSEWATIAADEDGERYQIVWQFPAVKGQEPDDDGWPWGDEEYIHHVTNL